MFRGQCNILEAPLHLEAYETGRKKQQHCFEKWGESKRFICNFVSVFKNFYLQGLAAPLNINSKQN